MSAGTDRRVEGRTHERRGDVTDAKLKRSAWLVGLTALAVYIAFIAWNLIRARLGI